MWSTQYHLKSKAKGNPPSLSKQPSCPVSALGKQDLTHSLDTGSDADMSDSLSPSPNPCPDPACTPHAKCMATPCSKAATGLPLNAVLVSASPLDPISEKLTAVLDQHLGLILIRLQNLEISALPHLATSPQARAPSLEAGLKPLHRECYLSSHCPASTSSPGTTCSRPTYAIHRQPLHLYPSAQKKRKRPTDLCINNCGPSHRTSHHSNTPYS